jgi:hypothetical protein
MKTKNKISLLLILTWSLLSGLTLFAQESNILFKSFQDTTATVAVKSQEGMTYYGKLKDNTNDTITIVTTDLGAIRIPYARIKSISPVVLKSGKYWFPTPLPGRYLFAPSAFTLKAGEGYYQNTGIALNSFNVGVTNWMSFGGGIEFFTTIGSISAGDFSPTFYVTPKIGFEVAKDLRLGAGILYLQILGSEFKLANFYGVVTYGNADYNISTGIGWGYGQFEDEVGSWQEKPMITLCGTARMSKKLAFVSENWFIPNADESGTGYYPIFSYGLRFMGESISVDFAFLNNKDIADFLFIGVPFVAFTVKF